MAAWAVRPSTCVVRGLGAGVVRCVVVSGFRPVFLINWPIHFFYINEKSSLLPGFKKYSAFLSVLDSIFSDFFCNFFNIFLKFLKERSGDRNLYSNITC